MSKATGQNTNSTQEGVETKTKYSFAESWQYLKAYVADVLDLQKGVDKYGTIKEIRDKKSMAGANAWMLICSIMIASIGLSMNSQAVIIGAMLISPLMSPILGIGLSVAINDMDTLRKSMYHFSVAIFIAILTSTLYFLAVNFIEMTPEIAARTSPTFLDIFVAIFGGLAGIISVARKDISTTIPGVAIATALMPPLCVTGYGLAHGDMDVASRSFYLFFLNTFFVALSTYLVVRFLDFPYKKYVKASERRRNVLFLSLFSLLLTIPSLVIFRGVLEDLNRSRSINYFKTTCLGDNAVYLDDYQYFEREGESDLLYLKVYGDAINKNKREEYESCLRTAGLEDVSIEILSSSDVKLDQIKSLQTDLSQLNEQLRTVHDKNQQQEKLFGELTKQYTDSSEFVQLVEELQVLYPTIDQVGLSKVRYSDTPSPLTTVIYQTNSRRAKVDNEQLEAFVKKRLKIDTVVVLQMR